MDNRKVSRHTKNFNPAKNVAANLLIERAKQGMGVRFLELCELCAGATAAHRTLQELTASGMRFGHKAHANGDSFVWLITDLAGNTFLTGHFRDDSPERFAKPQLAARPEAMEAER